MSDCSTYVVESTDGTFLTASRNWTRCRKPTDAWMHNINDLLTLDTSSWRVKPKWAYPARDGGRVRVITGEKVLFSTLLLVRN
ncbi:MAG TPA: hypothetical protein VGC58_01935 [Candidatus Paceibacterota bacterium]